MLGNSLSDESNKDGRWWYLRGKVGRNWTSSFWSTPRLNVQSAYSADKVVPSISVIVTPSLEWATVCTVALNIRCCTDKNSFASCWITVLNPLWSRDIRLSFENPPSSRLYVKLFPYINNVNSRKDYEEKKGDRTHDDAIREDSAGVWAYSQSNCSGNESRIF